MVSRLFLFFGTTTVAASAAASATLARSAVLPLSVVTSYFPDVSSEASNGANATATGKPIATRSVIFATHAGTRVTISVDQYATTAAASSAYNEALAKSSLPGMKTLPSPKVGQRAFAGTVTMNGETHVGAGALDGRLVIGATLAGYGASSDNVTKLAALLTRQDAAAKAALGL
jgi:hypothetical protein